MEITTRALWTLVHGFGIRCPLSPGVFRCARRVVSLHHLVPCVRIQSRSETLPQGLLLTMVVIAWAAVLTGTYVIYPCTLGRAPRRASPISPMFPQHLLMSSPTTIGWHSFGMEWKEHVAWFTPISITMASICLNPVWPRSQEPSRAPRHSALFCRGLVCGCRGSRASSRSHD